MSTLAERIEELIAERGCTAAAVARASGVSAPSVADWRSGKTKSLKGETVVRLSNFFAVNPEWITTGLGPKRQSGNAEEIGSNVELAPDLKTSRPVPHVGEVKGGADGYFEELQYPPGHGDGVIDYPTTDRNAYALRVRGDSMAPRYRAGEYIVVEPNVEPQPGEDVVVICHDGRKLLKTLAWIRDGFISLLSINNGFAPLTLELAEVERMHSVAGGAPARALRKTPPTKSTTASGSVQTSGSGPLSW